MTANKVVSSNIKIYSFLVVFILALFMATHSQGLHFKETKMSLFLHDFGGGSLKATNSFAAGIPGKEWGFFKFGTVSVADDFITQGIQPDSKLIARCQGMYTTCSLDGINAQAQISILFTNNTEYNGSTLVLQGLYNQVSATEIPIVSGTGKFRFARGYVTFETLKYHPSISYYLIGCNITVQQQY